MRESFIDELISAIIDQTKWTDTQARNFLSCMVAESHEELRDGIISAVDHAHRIEAEMAIVDLMKQNGKDLLQVKMGDEGLEVQLNPDIVPDLAQAMSKVP